MNSPDVATFDIAERLLAGGRGEVGIKLEVYRRAHLIDIDHIRTRWKPIR